MGTGLALLAGGTAVRLAGRRVRQARNADMEQHLGVPAGVIHHDLRTADGALLHVAELGSGSPVVLLHGFGLQWWVWAAQFRLLAGRHRVVAWDMRGHGRSTVGHDGVTLEAIADDLVTLLEQLDLHDAVVVGHSMGGMALAEACAKRHDVVATRVRGLMFLATSAALVDGETMIGAVFGLLNRVADLTGDAARLRFGWRDTNLSALAVRVAFGQQVSGAAVDDVRRMLSELDHDVAAAAARTIADHDVRDLLSHVDLPTKVVVGSADRLTSVAHAKVLVRIIEGAQLHVLDGIGHQVMQEAPEQLDELIEALATSARS
jgi:pimeloyl-ACP methyl ester carboxylesterase